jgi:hypothetical protein
MVEKSFVILRRIWRKLYKPTLGNLFGQSASMSVLLTPDVALKEMEQAFKSVFFSVEEECTFAPKKDPTPGRRLYFQFDRIAFRREAHHYAVDLFYNKYFSRKHGVRHAAAKLVGGDWWARSIT